MQNQYGFNVGGPVIKDKTFFFFSFEQFRLRQGVTYNTTVPTAAERIGNFSQLCNSGFTAADPGGSGIPVCADTDAQGKLTHQIYDPYTINTITGFRTPFAGNIIPATELNPAAKILVGLYALPTNSAVANNFTAATSGGGNTNQVDFRIDQNIGAKSRLFGRFNYNGLLDLPQNPFGTGLCSDRCSESYHTKAAVVDYNYSFTPKTIGDFNFSASRFIYLRSPINSGYDLTALGWPASYNTAVPSAARTPPTPCITEDSVSCSQGQSFIEDHNTQFNFSPQITMIRGRHTIQWGGQLEEGYDNYAQTNIASGFFGFDNSWTKSNPLTNAFPNSGEAIADLMLGLGQNQGQSVGNHASGVVQIPALTAGKQTYRALYINDTFHTTSKLTLNLGLRYELQGTWSERYGRLTYWNPNTNNATVAGCSGISGSTCPGDVFLVGTGVNHSQNNLPLDKRQFSPRLGFAYAFDSKTVVRGGYGVFWIPNYVSFGTNPDNDLINLATTPYVGTTDGGLTPSSTLTQSNCSFAGAPSFATFGCNTQGPFPNGLITPPGRSVNASAFAAGQALNQIAAYTNPKESYVEQWNLDIQRELPGGWFADVAYAGSKGVHLQQYATQVDQIPDRYLSLQSALVAPVTNPFTGIATGSLAPSVAPTIEAGQFLRPYPQYSGVSLAGYGCCDSIYHSLQVSVTKRFNGGGTLLAAYTNSKLISNTDTLTSWLEGNTGGVGAVQDWNNLAGERSLSSQDVPQRLVVSYVLDLPFGHGRKFMSGATGVVDKVIGGWGIDGVTTLQRGFPLKINYAGSTPLSSANLGTGTLRPNVVAGCNKSAAPSGLEAKLNQWFNTSCFAPPPAWGFGDESRVDGTLRQNGIVNFDFAAFKRVNFGPENRLGVEFRTEFFDLFNHPQFGPPNTALGSSTFGTVNSQVNNPRQIQFALKFYSDET